MILLLWNEKDSPCSQCTYYKSIVVCKYEGTLMCLKNSNVPLKSNYNLNHRNINIEGKGGKKIKLKKYQIQLNILNLILNNKFLNNVLVIIIIYTTNKYLVIRFL